MKKKNGGFSLIELIIAIAILVILTGLLAPQLMKHIEKAREAKDMQTLDSVRQAVSLALMDEDVINEMNNDEHSDSDLIIYRIFGTGKGVTLKAIEEDAGSDAGSVFSKQVMAALGCEDGAEIWVSGAVSDAGLSDAVYLRAKGDTGQIMAWVGKEWEKETDTEDRINEMVINPEKALELNGNSVLTVGNTFLIGYR